MKNIKEKELFKREGKIKRDKKTELREQKEKQK